MFVVRVRNGTGHAGNHLVDDLSSSNGLTGGEKDEEAGACCSDPISAAGRQFHGLDPDLICGGGPSRVDDHDWPGHGRAHYCLSMVPCLVRLG
jgi:hypothetical protein